MWWPTFRKTGEGTDVMSVSTRGKSANGTASHNDSVSEAREAENG